MLKEKFLDNTSNISIDKIFNSLEHIRLQDWPQSSLYIVATPIGNLGDITLRALSCLSMVDLIAVEDKRVSSILLNFYGIRNRIISAHKHNEREASDKICRSLECGGRVALISDAGTPIISDPGSKIIEKVRVNGYRIVPIPGPSAVVTALMSCGLIGSESSSYLFGGFVPAKHTHRLNWFAKLKKLDVSIVMFETPHRIRDSLKDLLEIYGPLRVISIARELTKKFEEIFTFNLHEFDLIINSVVIDRGEYVIVVHCESDNNSKEKDVSDSENLILSMISEGVPLSSVVKIVSKVTGLAKNKVYKHSLELISKNE